METAFRTRRLIALVAAYVVALQALLLPLTVAASASFDTSLCVSSASGDGSGPATGHDGGGPCAAGCGMQCCAPAMAGPPRIDTVLARNEMAAAAKPPVIAPVLVVATAHSPQSARAPPAA